MNISKIASSIAESKIGKPVVNFANENIPKITKPIGRAMNSAANKIGDVIEKKPFAQKITDIFEPNGTDNSFFGLASIMGLFVLYPRVKSALGRNPDDKEKTKDEVAEILFRDVQTILIVLFALKSMNSFVCNMGTKITGIPMVNKVYRKLVDENATTFVQKAMSAIKNFGKNALDTLNPIGGSRALSDTQIKQKYTGYKDLGEIQTFLTSIEEQGGKKDAVFNKIMDGAIAEQNKQIEIARSVSLANGEAPNLEKMNATKKLLEETKEAGVEKFLEMSNEENNIVTNILVNFFENENNSLAKSVKKVSAWLKTVTLGIEVGYLGFGLPALNQRRLEKKYLSEKPVGTVQNDTFSPLNDRHIKAQEIKLYGNFIK